MNGLIHPCCHDTAPLPEPESEEEMFDRIFDQIDKLFRVVRPRKCLVLCIDGVAPRSKMNQQRSRRFRAAQERIESNDIANDCADYIVSEHKLPRPQFRERWDHNVITPSTAFMERVGQSIEWFCMKKINEDPEWRNITVVYSDAHVPGEGEHKIMHYIRGLRAQPGYNPRTSHCIHGMDADLICLGLSTHEPNFGILRNKLGDDFQAVPNEFCYFNLTRFREQLKKDFENIKDMDFERVIDDFVFLCFFVGNDFLPHMPLISIKTKGIEAMLDHYVRCFDDNGYLTKRGEVKFDGVKRFLKSFLASKLEVLKKEYDGKKRAADRAKGHVKERVDKCQKEIEYIAESVSSDKATEEERQIASNKLLSLYSTIKKEELRFVAGRFPLTFSYRKPEDRDAYYVAKFGWSTEDRQRFEANVRQCCAEFLRGMQWVMRYYTKGCPSWEWFYPFHYTPLLQDLALNCDSVNVEMKIGEPLHPVEQLLAVLPRQSVSALPEELHEAVEDPKSVLAKFYPDTFEIDFTEANFSYQGIAQLPFINCVKLREACAELVELEEDFGTTLIFAHQKSRVSQELEKLIGTSAASVPLNEHIVRVCPLAGRVARYPNAWPLQARVECPDSGIANYPGGRFSGEIADNQASCFAYELNTHADYLQELLQKPSGKGDGKAIHKARSPGASHAKQQSRDGQRNAKPTKRERSNSPRGSRPSSSSKNHRDETKSSSRVDDRGSKRDDNRRHSDDIKRHSDNHSDRHDDRSSRRDDRSRRDEKRGDKHHRSDRSDRDDGHAQKKHRTESSHGSHAAGPLVRPSPLHSSFSISQMQSPIVLDFSSQPHPGASDFQEPVLIRPKEHHHAGSSNTSDKRGGDDRRRDQGKRRY
ncbi:exoribonuclease 2, putative [Bodo saltans]|uniref:Exoribonuclease 2, putative n=1 Tax=Bodo saltans TaxID=75058 RepID=A0A0S4IWC0_BODSA|nr:exoribonuclease 2, putative [Bodo saltans]|eukprot:CUG06170.1 exoribonuclease 2, putative [Bodo saltans]